ncbi:hypothetical protein NADFUDRAFT_49648 [Nadsonia fulvescens var. elongata DSM 6958]|uniref:Signal recognition particle subunit SRP72 n=1 Tax=Nadsonia fulvescens var. elongata DSM 6958 TaxID=857566 RepID=A0A1E3PPH7_9ASCO|nr:hypothetical protein NADFUDRAFT_49648 [Nadsonia fulvescens var. elongata DSM 6958]
MAKKDNKNVSVNDLFSKLNVHTEKEEYEGALDCAFKILESDESNTKAQQSVIRSYIQLELYNQAHKYISRWQVPNLEIETAYVLYKNGLIEELRRLVSQWNMGSNIQLIRAGNHILAQALYKLEKFDEVLKIYRNLLKGSAQVINEALDLSVNERAVIAQLSMNGTVDIPNAVSTHIDNSYDTLVNESIALTGKKQYIEALDVLKEARICCQNSPLSADEQEGELVSILLQAVFNHQLLGNIEEAEKILESIDTKGLQDPLLKRILINNTLCLRPESTANPLIALRQLSQAGVLFGLDDKTVGFQAQSMYMNEAFLDGQSGKRVDKYFNKVHSKSVSLVGAEVIALYSELSLTGEEPTRTQIAAFVNAIKKNPSSLPASLGLAQLYSSSENYDAAGKVLVEFRGAVAKGSNASDAFKPGLIGLLASLFRIQGRKLAACELIKTALTHWSTEQGLSNEVKAAALTLLDSNNEEDIQTCASLFENFYQANPDDFINIASVIACNPVRYAEERSKLISIDSIIADVDIAQIIENGVYPLLKKKTVANKIDPKVAAKIKRRKPKYPKDYDANKKPDPERWLPLRDRSSWKPKKKDKNNKNKTQGGNLSAAAAASENGIHQASSGGVVKANSSKNKKKKGKR